MITGHHLLSTEDSGLNVSVRANTRLTDLGDACAVAQDAARIQVRRSGQLSTVKNGRTLARYHDFPRARAFAVEQEHSWRPDRIKAVEPCRMFLNVSFYWKEILADEFGGLLIFIRLGIQPSTGSSGRSRAEVQQDGAKLLLRGG